MFHLSWGFQNCVEVLRKHSVYIETMSSIVAAAFSATLRISTTTFLSQQLQFATNEFEVDKNTGKPHKLELSWMYPKEDQLNGDFENLLSDGVHVTTGSSNAEEVWEQFWWDDKKLGLAHITTSTVWCSAVQNKNWSTTKASLNWTNTQSHNYMLSSISWG